MLDCARHFWSTKLIKKYIDLIAYYKMNVFHWHLTDDQGWRIEIKKYPKLTSVGAWRNDPSTGKKYGGFYTQDEG
jgi:hexosaminidase